MTESVKIVGLEPLLKKLDRLGKLPQTLRPVIGQQQTMIQKKLQHYPPELPNQKYVRTEKLKRSWVTRPPTFTRGGIRAIIFSDGTARTKHGEYAPLVMDARRQMQIHRGRWQTTKSVAEDVAPGVNRAIKAAVDKELAK
jgi:hypothetical protein